MFTAASMETLKLFLDGKKPDPTDALIAAAAAALACFAATRLAHWPAENLINGKPAQLQALPRQKLARTSSPKRITLLFMLVIALAISLLTLHRDASAAPDAPEAAREPSPRAVLRVGAQQLLKFPSAAALLYYLSTTNVLCPRQQEFNLPLYSFLGHMATPSTSLVAVKSALRGEPDRK
jgi:hypothetical protein